MSLPISSNPRPAATVVTLRDGASGPEVFMVRRHERTVFMGGAHVFPGGRVDATDEGGDESWCDGVPHATKQLGTLPPREAVAYHVAAARELFEEAGVLLARDADGRFVSLASAGAHARFKHDREDVHSGRTPLRAVIERETLRLALDTLVLFAHWVTPPIDTRQFDTRFFMTRVPPDQTPAHDETETTHSTWITPAEAMKQSREGDIVLPPPTWTTLRELEAFATVEQALVWARRRRVVRRMPKVLEHDGRRMLVLPGDPLHPESAGPRGEDREDPPVETRFVFVDRRWRAERSRT
ncbi:MAG: NUDIX domain-containing protein [Acidobacteria bacterium]|nr:NUDIX domain-containing protein [Acidobacteriota bacterium]